MDQNSGANFRMPLKSEQKRQGGRPRKCDAEALPGAILEAAWEVFREQGYKGASVDVVAARAKVSKRTLYDRFGSKESLFEATFTHASSLWQDEVLERLNVESPDWLEHFTVNMLEMLSRGDLLVLAGIFTLEARTYPWAARVEDIAVERGLTIFGNYLGAHLPRFPEGESGRLVTRGAISLLTGWAINFSRIEPKISSRYLQTHIAGELRVLLAHHGCFDPA